MTIFGLKDLEYYRLQIGDVVNFRIRNKQGEFVYLKYTVEDNFLMIQQDIFDASPSDRYYNDEIFRVLGLDSHKFCSKYYGYESNDGIWPRYKDYDLEAATNVVKALYTLIDTMNGEWLRVKGDLCTNLIWNGKEFGYNDTDGGWKPVANIDYSSDTISICSTTSADSTPSSDLPIDKLKKISSQIKTIKQDNNSKLKRI